jgi:FkbM family methyltransferase
MHHYLNNIKKYFYPRTILDIGANVGEFYVFCRTIFNSSYIFCIEANPHCEPYLKSLTDNYLISLVTEKEGLYDFYSAKNKLVSTGNSLYKENTSFYNDENVEITQMPGVSLNSLFPNGFVFDLIKIDTQGSELDILKGGAELYKKSRGIILEVSLTEYNINSPLKPEVVQYMIENDFVPVEILEELSHPETQLPIQQSILFLNSKYFSGINI